MEMVFYFWFDIIVFIIPKRESLFVKTYLRASLPPPGLSSAVLEAKEQTSYIRGSLDNLYVVLCLDIP
jgi:hypothetical protein